jgi:rare lipoprotein A
MRYLTIIIVTSLALATASTQAQTAETEAATESNEVSTVSQPVTFVSIPVVQPLPEPAAVETFVASYYGGKFHGRKTANGERFNMNALTAAHKTLPFGTRLRVTNPESGQSVTVRINDRGPYIRGRDLDLSRAAAEQIGLIQAGHGQVAVEVLN